MVRRNIDINKPVIILMEVLQIAPEKRKRLKSSRKQICLFDQVMSSTKKSNIV